MWPPVRQFESYERVPFEHVVHPREGARRARSRPRRRVLAAASIVSVALVSGSYVVAASAVPRSTPASPCLFAQRSHVRSVPSVFCELAGSATSAGRAHFHRWP
jgi:hypothetical protein